MIHRQDTHTSATIKKLINTAVQNILSKVTLDSIIANIRQLPEEETIQTFVQNTSVAQPKSINNNEPSQQKVQQQQPNPSPTQQLQTHHNQIENKSINPPISQPFNQQPQQLNQNRQQAIQNKQQDIISHPTIQNQKIPSTQQKQSVQSQKDSKNIEPQESINLEFTLKTKNYHNISMQKADSLTYSNATYQNSNAFGFGLDANSNSVQQQSFPATRSNSQKEVLNAIQDREQAQVEVNMERTISRQVERVRSVTEGGPQDTKKQQKNQSEDQGQLFPTVVNAFKNKISMMRELKSQQKKRLQLEINRINKQLQELAADQARQHSSGSRINSYESRVKIADNIEAKIKAQRLVRHLKYDKKLRYDSKLGKLEAIDKNINLYMQELMKQKYKHDESKKQKKKLQIIQRMKQQQLRKIQIEQKKNKNIQFLHKLQMKDQDPRKGKEKEKEKQSANFQKDTQPQKQNNIKLRSPTKKSEYLDPDEATQSLSRKKAYLKRIRNFNFKKEKFDEYEQVLM